MMTMQPGATEIGARRSLRRLQGYSRIEEECNVRKIIDIQVAEISSRRVPWLS